MQSKMIDYNEKKLEKISHIIQWFQVYIWDHIIKPTENEVKYCRNVKIIAKDVFEVFDLIFSLWFHKKFPFDKKVLYNVFDVYAN